VVSTDLPKSNKVQILGVDVLLVGQEYWVSADQFCALEEIYVARYPGYNTGVEVGVMRHNGRPIIYKPEMD